jgi:sugar phosphate isomerase/epimerase
MTASFQLYSARSVPDTAAFLSTLADLGYAQVEGYGGVYGDAAGFRDALDKTGLTMPSGHFGIEDLENNWDDMRAIAGVLGIKQIYAPHLAEDQRPTDADGWRAFAARLESVYNKANDAGLIFGWHNHDFEFTKLATGETPMDIILAAAPNIALEADLGWVARSGTDTAAFITRYADRITAAHVKDVAAAGTCQDEDGWADVGHGTMPWADIAAQVRAANPNALMVIEHDNPSDVVRFAQRSIAAFKEY